MDNYNEWSAECVLQLIESPCRREIGQIDTESDKMREEDKGDDFIQSNSGWFMSHLNLLSYERPQELRSLCLGSQGVRMP